MIQFILTLLGLVVPSNNNNSAPCDYAVIVQISAINPSESEETSGETGNIPPPKKPDK